MKKILLSAIGLLGFAMSFAQSPIVYEDENVQIIDSVQASFEEIVDSIFANVDLSQVPSGILVDKTLSTLDYSNFTGQPEMPEMADLKQWRHLYHVFFRNANNEAQKWQADLQDSLAMMDNLIRERGLFEDASTPSFCNLQINDPQGWKVQYERVRTNVLKAAEQYPPKLPRIRKWISHVDKVLQDMYALETNDEFTVLNDSNRVDFLSWMQLYNLMNLAAIDPQQPPLPELEEVLDDNQEEGQPIPLLFLDMQYHRIQPDAVERDLLRFNGIQLSDVAGRTESPYEAMTMLAATPAAIRLEMASPSFIIRPEHILGNQQKTIKNFTIDFGDGAGFLEVGFNEPIPVQYAEGGEKQIIFKVTYEDCSFALSHAVVAVAEESLANGRNMRTKNLIGAPDDEFTIRAERPHEGGFASGHVSIEYGCGNDRLMKPFIIVEGFNPEQFEVFEQGSFYLQFLDKINEENEPLRIALQNSGYDLVYLDYDDGGTYIQRNAYLLQTLIKRVNAMKEANGSTEPNVIMGTSMGGLVIRYALAEMERPRDGRTPEEHDTRLYISFDSPHQGANVPLGFQYAAYHLPKVRVAKRSIQEWYEKSKFVRKFITAPPNIGVKMMETPAARQMLKLQAVLFQDNELINNNPYHEEFMEEYHKLGYPTQCRNVAIANGSQIGQGQNFDPGSLLLSVKSNGLRASPYVVEYLWDELGLHGLPPILGGPARVLTAAVALPVFNFVFGYEVNLKVWALEDNSNDWQTVYRGYISGRFLGVPAAFSTFKVRVKKVPALDSAPGGRIDYANGGEVSGPVKLKTGAGSFCLVPTVSALDLREPDNEDLYGNVQEREILANARTAFLDYDAPDEGFVRELPNGEEIEIFNEFHTSFTGFNARLFQQYLIGTDLPDNLLTNEYYNFGAGSTLNTSDRMSDIILNSGGQLLVNANIPIGPAEDAGENPLPFPNSTFEVKVSPATNCNFQNGEVEVRAGGEIILGENNPANRGIMRFQQGSTLILESGSRLVISENSQLIIECGATLIFSEGATIETEGDPTRLTIDGNLQLPSGLDFPYDYNTGNPSPPDVTTITVEGPDLVCTEGATFALSRIPEDTEVCWSVTGDQLFIEGDRCGNTVLVKAKSSAVSASGEIQASIRFTGSCEDIEPSTIIRELKVGPISSTDLSISGGASELCPNTYYTFYGQPKIEASYAWVATGLGTIINSNNNSVYLLTNDNPTNGALALQIDNGCGLSGSIDKTFAACEAITFSTFPIPASNSLNITIEENEEPATDVAPYELSIYDDRGVLTKKQQFKNKKFKMDISDLPDKVYYLQLKHKEKQVNKKIIVKN